MEFYTELTRGPALDGGSSPGAEFLVMVGGKQNQFRIPRGDLGGPGPIVDGMQDNKCVCIKVARSRR